jgi:CheY-like chemotaxis protein
MPHALVIDDHDLILQIVGEKLQSLDHTFDAASSQEEAEHFLRRQSYDYILLDLAIPLRFGGQADKQFGRNLLHKIRGALGHQSTAVIIMTADDLLSYHVGVELMKEGADDFVGKPFGDDHPLERKIREALAKRNSNPSVPGNQVNQERRPFDGAELSFFEDRVEINGRKITGKSSQMRSALECLRKKRESGDTLTLGGTQLANQCGFDNGEKTANDAVRQIRDKVCDSLLRHDGVHAVGSDIVVTDDTGYTLGSKVVIRVRDCCLGDASVKLNDIQLRILRELRANNNYLSCASLAANISVTSSVIRNEVKHLLANKFLDHESKGKGLSYKLIKDPMSPL